MPVFRIRMDPSFFADPDPDFKNPDTDSSVFAFHIFNNQSDLEKSSIRIRTKGPGSETLILVHPMSSI